MIMQNVIGCFGPRLAARLACVCGGSAGDASTGLGDAALPFYGRRPPAVMNNCFAEKWLDEVLANLDSGPRTGRNGAFTIGAFVHAG